MNGIWDNSAALGSTAVSMLTPGTPAKAVGISSPLSLVGGSANAAASSSTTSSSSSSATNNSDITSSDFLTLLVSELQNQDPTQPTDPNAYITQLVGVNSLQQLISINQDLTPSSSTTSATQANATQGL